MLGAVLTWDLLAKPERQRRDGDELIKEHS